MKITTIPDHMHGLYKVPEGWTALIINGGEAEIKEIDDWLKESVDPSSYSGEMKYGGSTGRSEQHMKFNYHLRFDSGTSAVAIKLRYG